MGRKTNKQSKEDQNLQDAIKKLQQDIKNVEIIDEEGFVKWRKSRRGCKPKVSPEEFGAETMRKKKQTKSKKKVIMFDKEIVDDNTGHKNISRHLKKYGDPENMDEFIFNNFISLFEQGLYDFNSLALRLGKNRQQLEDMINASPRRFARFKEAVEIANLNVNKDNLVQKALLSLSKQVDGEDVVLEKRYKIQGGKKVLKEEIEKNKGMNINATKLVLETFTDVFGKDMTPEKVGRLFISFNEYIYRETYDDELIKQLLTLQEGYLNQLFIKQ